MSNKNADYINLDSIVLVLVIIVCTTYYYKNFIEPEQLRAKARAKANSVNTSKPKLSLNTKKDSNEKIDNTNFVQKYKNSNSQGIIFFGTQTGTAEDFSNRLAKDLKRKYNLNFLVLDLEEYDLTNFEHIPSTCIVLFLLSTYGEGEPTDNAVEFYNLFYNESTELNNSSTLELKTRGYTNEDKPLKNLNYSIFGLGNRTYEHFNKFALDIDNALKFYGANSIFDIQLGDDDANLEEDFLTWKDKLYKPLCEKLNIDIEDFKNLEPIKASFTIEEVEKEDLRENDNIYDGHIYTEEQAILSPRIFFDSKKPFYAPIKFSKQLFQSNKDNRYAIHAEFDIQGSDLNYSSGDHLGIYPINSSNQVELFKKVFNLKEKENKLVRIKLNDKNQKQPFPNPSTYNAILNHYLDISSSPSREFIINLISLAKTDAAKKYLSDISNPDNYHTKVINNRLTISEIMHHIQEKLESNSDTKTMIPVDVVFDNLPRLPPRFYSISSSGLKHPNTPNITVTVLRFNGNEENKIGYGIFSNLLLSIHENEKKIEEGSKECQYNLKRLVAYSGLNKNDELKMPVFIRKSNFKLPKNPEVPIIMIGPGTGVAPFRGFLQEREIQVKKEGEEKVGETLLFFGCRNSNEDFLYKEEWDGIFKNLGSKAKMYNAFSRETDKKVYVQHLIEQNGEYVFELIKKNATIYICGDAKYMAKDVQNTLIEILSKHGNCSLDEAKKQFEKIKLQNRFQEDVWS